MTRDLCLRLQAAIMQLLSDIESQHTWGGSEDEDGSLQCGDIDWDSVKQRANEIFEDICPTSEETT